MYNSIRGQRHAKLATIYIAQKAFQKSGNNQCKYEKVDGLMDQEVTHLSLEDMNEWLKFRLKEKLQWLYTTVTVLKKSYQLERDEILLIYLMKKQL